MIFNQWDVLQQIGLVIMVLSAIYFIVLVIGKRKKQVAGKFLLIPMAAGLLGALFIGRKFLFGKKRSS